MGGRKVLNQNNRKVAKFQNFKMNTRSTSAKESPTQSSNLQKLLAQDSVRNALQDIQTSIVKQLSEQMQEFRNETKASAESTNKKIDMLCETLQKTQHKFTKMEQDIQELKAEKDEMQARLATLEMEKASYFLRIQNVAQLEGETEEDLLTLIAEELSEQTGIEQQEFTQAVERIFRVSNAYTRRNNLPKEVHIKFLRRTVKEKLLKVNKKKDLTIKGVKINIVKQVPWTVRKKRQEYTFLTKILLDRKIPFQWRLPEGLVLNLSLIHI